MKTVLVTILLVTLCAAELERPVRFDGQKLVWIETSKITPEQLTAINESPDFDVWSQSMEGMSVRVDGEALQS